MRSIILSLAGLFVILFVHAQTKEPFNSGDVLQKGAKLYEEGKYKEAFKVYQQVPRNDTNYSAALYEASLCCFQDSNYTICKKLCEEGLKLQDKTNERLFYVTYGSALDNALEFDKALQVYDSALVKYPNSENLLLNKAIVLLRAKRTDEAEALLKKLLVADPYYASAHYTLGKIALSKGQVIPATLSLFTYLLCSPSGTYSSNAISTLGSIGRATDEIVATVNQRKEQPAASFASVEQIVLSKIALDKSYKSAIRLDDQLLRQLQVICEKLNYDSDDNDFWMQFYVPVYKAIWDQKQFEPIVFQAFSGVQLDDIKKYVKGNAKEINKAVQVVTTILNKLRSTRELNFEKRTIAPELYHFSDDELVAKGLINAADKLNGPFEFYFANGNLKSAGDFDADGKKDGTWKFYYATGGLSSIEHWQHGVQEGEETIYHTNGEIKEHFYYRNGKVEGERKTFYLIGTPQAIEHYKNDKLDGLVQRFSAEGRKTSELTYKDGEVEGRQMTYFKNGQIEKDIMWSNGKYNGPYKTYYDNGQLSFTCNYIAGKGDGPVKDYYRSGKIQKERTYQNDVQIGEEREYSEEGVLTSLGKYENGKLNGPAQYYDRDGKLYCTFIFDKDILKSAHYFNKEGKEISVSERSNKAINLTNYNYRGIKTSTLLYNDKGQKQGIETFYYSNGAVKEVNNYVDGKLTGISKGFYADGKKQFEITYREGEKDGYEVYYHPNGKVKFTGWYREGTVTDSWEYFDLKGNITDRSFYADGDFDGLQEHFFPTGKHSSEEQYSNGWINVLSYYDTSDKKCSVISLSKSSGAYKPTYPSGKMRLNGTYLNSELNGTLKGYYFDGSPRFTRTFDRGQLEGENTEWHNNGVVAIQGNYKNNKKEGVWKYYSEDNKLHKEENYRNGELDGKIITYYPNGKKDIEEDYKDGNSDGGYYCYAETGELVGVFYYDRDELVGYSYQDKNGKLMPRIEMPGGNGKITMYFPNGQRSFEANYKAGAIDGAYAYYFTDGKPSYSASKELGNRQGKRLEYFPNGKVKSEYNFYYDQPDGAYKEYYENGTLKEEGNYYLGDLHGIRKLYSETGTLLKKEENYYGALISVSK